ncbi:MAG: class I SAM-dependent methyltransferase [Chloroflexaceae bacterium]|nr:class I SAM-dependent methyltransferase [Chloroflexaceae bacterium]
MKLSDIITFARTHNLLSLNRITSDMQVAIRMHFLYAAIESGLLEALRTPRSREELIHQLEVQRPEILDALLDVGCALKELACQHSHYRIIGKRSLSLVGRDGDILAAIVQASTTYYCSVYQHAPERLRGAPSGPYLEEIGDIVARIGKITEPFVQGFVRDTVAGKGKLWLLDVGCGSGIYLRTARTANPHVSGIGIDMDATVVQQARDNLAQWGLSEHFTIIAGDIRHPPPDLQRPFDVINLSNIIYYFSPEERTSLFHTLREMLGSGGVLAMVSNVQSRGTDVVSANLNMATSSMIGCTPLPDLDSLQQQIQACGFSEVRATRLVPGSAFYGITAQRPSTS